MKTLLITENFPPKSGGSGRWFWELYSRLPKEEYQVLAGHFEGDEAFDTKASISISRTDLYSPEWGFASTKGLKFYLSNFFKVRRYIKKNNITHLHCGRVLPEGVIAWLINLFTGMPYVCYVHGEDLETAKSSREQYWICGQVIKRAKTIICNSENSASLVAAFGQNAIAKTKVLHPGVDSSVFVPKPRDAETLQKLNWVDKKVALTVGRLQARKGQDMMIKAIPQIVKSIPNFLYAVVGDGDQKQVLIDLVEELGVQQHVQFLSEISDQKMIECYQQCDLFILPNRTIGQDIEGFGMVLVEAQSCGKPVIAGDSGGTKETMIVGETGFIVDATNSTKIASHVTELMISQKALEDIGSNGRTHVLLNLDWKVLVNKGKELFKS